MVQQNSSGTLPTKNTLSSNLLTQLHNLLRTGTVDICLIMQNRKEECLLVFSLSYVSHTHLPHTPFPSSILGGTHLPCCITLC
jgi:hypothetical protein